MIYKELMDEDNLNIEIRKFLKKVGISSQRIIESSIINKVKSGEIKINDEINLEMRLNIKNFKEENIISEKIKIK